MLILRRSLLAASTQRPDLLEVGRVKARLRHKPARAAACHSLGILPWAGRCEEDRQPGAGPRQQVADLKAVVVAKAYVQENGLRLVALDGFQRGRSARSLGDNVIAARAQEHPGSAPERDLVVNDHDPWIAALGRLCGHRAMD